MTLKAGIALPAKPYPLQHKPLEGSDMHSSMRSGARAGLLALLLAAGAGGASALSLGQSDTFSGGSLQGWSSGGGANPNAPAVVAGGGPGGAADSFLLLSANGVPQEPGSKLVAFAGPQWLGDYTAAGITGLSMAVKNFGATDLSLRLFLAAPGGAAVSKQAVSVPAGSGWLPASFSLLPGALTGQGIGALAGATEVRLFHSAGAVFPGPGVVAQLGVDNVTAVPEPAGAALMLAGLAGLFLHCRRPRRASA